jgi:hypothetical protein
MHQRNSIHPRYARGPGCFYAQEMLEIFLRRPVSSGEKFADLVRLVGLLSLVITAAGWGVTEMTAISMAVVALAIPRLFAARPALDASFGIAVLVAAWSIVFGLYSKWANWDLVVHAATNGLIAAVAVLVLLRVGLLASSSGLRFPRASFALVTTMVGVTLGVIWEYIEWAGNRFMDASIFVNYTDTLGDIAAGGLGSLAAGCAMRFFLSSQRTAPISIMTAADDLRLVQNPDGLTVTGAVTNTGDRAGREQPLPAPELPHHRVRERHGQPPY